MMIRPMERRLYLLNWGALIIMDRLILDLSPVEAEKIKGAAAPVARRIFTEAPEAPELSFQDMLSASIRKVNSLQLEAGRKVRDLAIGEVEDISEVVLASSRADIALRLLMELRNKFLDAYQALSRITG